MSPAGQLLGKYAPIITAVVIVAIVIAGLAQELLFAMASIPAKSDTISTAFVLAIGIILGGTGALAQLNGTVKTVAKHDQAITTLAEATPGVEAVNGTVRLSQGDPMGFRSRQETG
jgi:hypothetical protein